MPTGNHLLKLLDMATSHIRSTSGNVTGFILLVDMSFVTSADMSRDMSGECRSQ